MTITKALTQLQTLLEKHGDVQVYFDCPLCDRSYTPDVVKPVAVHLSTDTKPLAGGKVERR